jgi:5-(carboxyamino)imidazole ribonucleotide synthase
MMLAPGATIGILGGGQLGRMTAAAAARLGYRSHVFTPESDSPAGQVTPLVTTAAFDDEAALARFADAVDVVTFEFENVPAETAEFIAARGRQMHPGPAVLRVTQDRLREKDFLRSIAVGTTAYREVTSLAGLRRAVRDIGPHGVLKTVRLGYDGKGQLMLGAGADLSAAWRKIGGEIAILESFVDFACEVSVIVARNGEGAIAAYPPVENQHVNHILDTTIAPARIAAATASRRSSPSSACSPSRCSSRRRAICSSTSWHRDRTIPATGPSTRAIPASSSSSYARSAACRSARPTIIPRR